MSKPVQKPHRKSILKSEWRAFGINSLNHLISFREGR